MDMKTAIYLRVSSVSQTTASQEEDLKAWAKSQKEAPAWYRETATGTTMTRKVLATLLYRVRVGEVKRVVVWRLDRLGRTARGLLEFCEELQSPQMLLRLAARRHRPGDAGRPAHALRPGRRG